MLLLFFVKCTTKHRVTLDEHTINLMEHGFNLDAFAETIHQGYIRWTNVPHILTVNEEYYNAIPLPFRNRVSQRKHIIVVSIKFILTM